MHSVIRVGAFALAGVAMSACGGGGGSSAPAALGQGTLSVAMTDAPVDDVTELHIEFDGVVVKPKNGAQLEFPFTTPVTLDLAMLTEDNTATLLNGEVLPAGEYNWIRLDVNADCDTVMDSFVRDQAGGQVELRVPSARGLQLSSGFVITANQNTSFVIDWDLRKGLNNPQGSSCYKLKPSLRIVDMTAYGSIEGTVSDTVFGEAALACTSDINTGAGNVVYVYEGLDVTPDDIDDVDPEPVTTANVRWDAQSETYRYMAAFLSPGDYTVALTCQGTDDQIPDPDMPELDADDAVVFTAGTNVTVAHGVTAQVNFE
jgi:hypothetical protein